MMPKRLLLALSASTAELDPRAVAFRLLTHFSRGLATLEAAALYPARR